MSGKAEGLGVSREQWDPLMVAGRRLASRELTRGNVKVPERGEERLNWGC